MPTTRQVEKKFITKIIISYLNSIKKNSFFFQIFIYLFFKKRKRREGLPTWGHFWILPITSKIMNQIQD